MMVEKGKVILGILALVLCGCSAETESVKSNQGKQEEAVSCTMQEAWAIAEREAREEWAEDAAVTMITSTDNHDTEQETNGMDGRRNCWNFLFHSQSEGKEYSVYVINGEVMYGKETAAPWDGFVLREDIPIDSDDMYQIALENHLQGGTDWAWGYHYGLQYRYMEMGEEAVLTMSVRGLNEDGNEKYIIADPYTGTVIASSEKVGYDEEGRAIWQGEIGTSEPPELTREWVEEKFDIFGSCVKYKMDPAELTDRIIDQYYSNYFSPFSDIASYPKEEWEKRMTDYYGENWKERLEEETEEAP